MNHFHYETVMNVGSTHNGNLRANKKVKKLGLVAGWQKQKAGGRMLQPAGLAGQAGLCLRSPVRVGGREGATQQQKRIFCYEMYFKHDLPHDVG